MNTENLINRDKPQKLYIQVLEILRKKIESGEWDVGSQIPIEEDLCKIYEVSKATIRLAVLELVRQGYLVRQQGKGTFVCKRVIPEGLTMSTSFKELMLEAGVVFSTRVLAQTVIMPTDDLDIKLEIPDDKHVIYIKRLRLIDNEPAVLQETYVPYHTCPTLLKEDIADQSILEIFEQMNDIPITNVKSYIEVAYTNEEESRLLGLASNSPALLLEQHFYSGETQIMYTRSVKRPDRFRLTIEMEKKVY